MYPHCRRRGRAPRGTNGLLKTWDSKRGGWVETALEQQAGGAHAKAWDDDDSEGDGLVDEDEDVGMADADDEGGRTGGYTADFALHGGWLLYTSKLLSSLV